MPANVYEPASAAAADRFTASLRGFGPLGLAALVVVLLGNAVFIPLSAILAIVWARLARIPLSELGFVRPQRWIPTVLGGVAFGAALKLVVMPLFGADPVNQAGVRPGSDRGQTGVRPGSDPRVPDPQVPERGLTPGRACVGSTPGATAGLAAARA